jgi:diguanylate cyclase (GGDEF)-like protein
MGYPVNSLNYVFVINESCTPESQHGRGIMVTRRKKTLDLPVPPDEAYTRVSSGHEQLLVPIGPAERGVQSAPGTVPDVVHLREQLAAAERRNDELEAELAQTQMAQQQLQSYADDFRRIYAESRQRLHQMTTLYEVSTAIAGTVDPTEVTTRTVDGLGRLLPGAGAAVYLLEEDGRLARRRAVLCPPGTPKPPETLGSTQGLLARTLQEGQVVSEGPHSLSGSARGPLWRMALPLTVGEQKLGALLVLRQGDQPFALEESYVAELVASQTAMALQHARLATTDSLTSLYNRRYFEHALEVECERARRAGRPIGLLMVDVDRFKRFNEQFGHPAGDAVLRRVAAVLAGQLRRTDILARLGGEEFAAILPEADEVAVSIAAERLRGAVERSTRLNFEGASLPLVYVSVGGVSMTDDAASPHTLVKVADDALRQAKRTGRNRTVVPVMEGRQLAP